MHVRREILFPPVASLQSSSMQFVNLDRSTCQLFVNEFCDAGGN